ncbi:MAG TPA: hypothetical protein VJT67_13415 [Longimicrobiaceae bacterium]|nr:hypothetical protein [Longimicrobiaceae bacterium]
MSTAVSLLIRFGLIVFVVALGANPRWRLSRFMFKSRGPRTDVVCLTRRQLFAEGAKFIYLAVCCFAAMWAAIGIGDAVGVDLLESTPGGVVVFILALLMVVCAVAGVYMLLRGAFRSRSYVPPAHCGAQRVRGSDEIARDATRPITW